MNETLMVLVRGVIAVFTLFIFARILGKQQMSQLTYFDYILGITIGSIAATLTTNLGNNTWSEWVGLFTWFVLVFIIQMIAIKSRYIAKYMDGEPTVVIMNGHIMEDAMKTMRYSIDHLLGQLRLKGIFDLTQVEFAVLETNGKLSVQKKSEFQPVTAKDLNLSTSYSGLSTEVIFDGIVLDQNMEQLKLDRLWLDAELKKLGIDDYSEVALASLDTAGRLYVDTYNDRLKSLTDPSDYRGPN